MRFLVRATIPVDAGNDLVRDPDFGKRIQALMGEIKPEAAYFALESGQRTVYMVVTMADAHQLPAIAEPLWLNLSADVDFIPVLDQSEMNRAMPTSEQIAQKF